MATQIVKVSPSFSPQESPKSVLEDVAPVVLHGALIPIIAIVEMGHGVFEGIQRGYPDLNLEPLVLFRPQHLRTTLALKLSHLTSEAVEAKIVGATVKFLKGQTA